MEIETFVCSNLKWSLPMTGVEGPITTSEKSNRIGSQSGITGLPLQPTNAVYGHKFLLTPVSWHQSSSEIRANIAFKVGLQY